MTTTEFKNIKIEFGHYLMIKWSIEMEHDSYQEGFGIFDIPFYNEICENIQKYKDVMYNVSDYWYDINIDMNIKCMEIIKIINQQEFDFLINISNNFIYHPSTWDIKNNSSEELRYYIFGLNALEFLTSEYIEKNKDGED